MPISFRCPECGGLLSVPRKYVGQTINCPHSGCAVLVTKELASQGSLTKGDARSGVLEVGTGLADGQGTKPAASGVTEPAPIEISAGRVENGFKPLPAAKAPGSFRNKTARFITSDTNATAEKIAADGKLPELTLVEGTGRRSAGEAAKETSPLFLISLLCLSFGLSAILLMVDFAPATSQTNKQADARAQLAAFYKESRGTLLPYQQNLRAAQQAYSRGDRDAEREEYRKVVSLLRNEGRGRFSSLTRTHSEDRKLEELLIVLLAE